MLSLNAHRRRLSITHGKHGALSVRIFRNNDKRTYILLFILSTIIFVWIVSLMLAGLVRSHFSKDSWYMLAFAAFIVLWYLTALRVSLWRSYGIEELLVQSGRLLWTRKALFWVRKLEFPTQSVTRVEAVTPWHGLSNRVELTVSGKHQRIGDMLLHDEAIDLARQLRHAVGLV
ncbi:MAG: DUF2244 domain-containing protein [Acidobacteria bacterium]|nr:DUF2244 domain-containing protein [Acidobacteriota bacterium]